MSKMGRRALGWDDIRTVPYPHGFVPKHCAGALDQPSSCFHRHPGDVVCRCGTTWLASDDDAVTRQQRPYNNGPFIRHTRSGCHQVRAVAV